MKINREIINKIIEILSSFLIALYPCLYMYFNNIGEAFFLDIVPISIIFMIISAILLLLTYFLFKNITKAIFCSNIILFLLLNFKSIEDFLNNMYSGFYYWHVVIIIIFIIISLIIFLIQYNFKELKNMNKILTLIFAFLIIFNFATSLPKIIKMNNLYDTHQDNVTVISKVENNSINKPNFYFLIFDEYGGPENLSYFMQYDNRDFYNNLEKNNVNVSYTSRNKDISTIAVIVDLVNFEFISNSSITTHESMLLRHNAKLVQLFKEHGYKFNKITNDAVGKGFEIDYSSADSNIESTTETAYGMIINATIFYPLNFNISDNYVDNLKSRLNYMYDSIKLEDGGVFTFGHFNLPHLPFVFDEYGNINPNYLYRDIENSETYLKQLKYTSKIIEKYISLIKEKDPKAIVLIQSDHGCRLVQQRNAYLGQREPTQEEIEYMKSILNILYYQGEKVDISGMSGYDTLKLVVNKILNTNIQ